MSSLRTMPKKRGSIGVSVRTKSKCINSGLPTLQMGHQNLTAERPIHTPSQETGAHTTRPHLSVISDSDLMPTLVISVSLQFRYLLLVLYCTQHYGRQGYTAEQRLRRRISSPMGRGAKQDEQEMAPNSSVGSLIIPSPIHPQPNSIGPASTWDSMSVSA